MVMWDATLLVLIIIIALVRHLLKFGFVVECFKAKLKDSYLPCEASALFLQVVTLGNVDSTVRLIVK